ncbi:MAG: helix-hairpin-helix domain-containing protein [Geobacteraceae bacterium]|nr:helix-hairpin-helix domain-containing protein [Geobacteraceae bacterium]
MSLTARDLQKIRGIGDVLSARLIEEGHDTFTKIVQLGESGLKSIKGINPKAITDIITQAGQLAAYEPGERDKKVSALKESLNRLRLSVQSLTTVASERFSEKLSGKTGRKMTESLVSFIEAVESIEETTGKKVKRTGKALLKAEKRLEGLADAGLKDLRKGLKKAKKALQRVHE